jgi:outer membrane protein TolC
MLNARNQWSLSQKNAHNQELELKFWMGMPIDEALKLVKVNWQADRIRAYKFDSLYLQTHPAYLTMQSQVLLSESQMQQIGVSRLPKLTAYAGYSQLAFRNDFDFFDGSREWYSTGQLGLRLNIPIFSRGQISGDVRINRLQLDQAQKRLSDFELEKRTEYQQLINDLQTSQESIES